MRLHLVDGTYELYRSEFSKRPDHITPDGRSVRGSVGLVASLLALMHDEAEAVTHVAVAFDHPIRSFRNDLFDGYKSDDGVPERISSQFDEAERAVAALGMTVWPMDEFEADDALATAAHRFANDVDQVRIMTPDKDLAQCVRSDRVVLVDRRREVVIDETGVHEKWGVAPKSIPDYLALVGDDADGIPGLPRFGAKTSAQLLRTYDHIDAIPSDPATWTVKVRGAAALSTILEGQRTEADLYRRLATLVSDVPLAECLDDLRWRGVPRARFSAWCDDIDSDSLRRRPRRWDEAL